MSQTDLWSRLIHGGKDSYLRSILPIGHTVPGIDLQVGQPGVHLGYSYTAIDLFAGLAFSMVGLIALSMSLRTALRVFRCLDQPEKAMDQLQGAWTSLAAAPIGIDSICLTFDLHTGVGNNASMATVIAVSLASPPALCFYGQKVS